MTEAKWYLAKNGTALGPFDLACFRRMAAAGAVGPDDLVCPDGGAAWVAATAVPGLFAPPLPAPDPAPAAEPPAPPQEATHPPAPEPSRCPRCGGALGPAGGAKPTAVCCPHCGAVFWARAAGATAAAAALFAVLLLVAVHAADLWVRAGAAAGCLVPLVWLPVLWYQLLEAAELRHPDPAGPGAGPPRHVRVWTAVAAAAFVGASVCALVGYRPAGPGTPADPPAAEVRYALRGEALVPGDVLTVTTRTDALGARLQARGADGATDVRLDSRRARADEWTLGAAAGRRPTRLTARLVRADGRERVLDGTSPEETTSSPLAGVLVAEFARPSPEGPWTRQVAPTARPALQARGAAVLAEAEAEVAATDPWDAGDDLYPDGPVAAGHEWVRAGAALRPLLGADARAVEGEGRFKVAGFTQVNGLTCARITFAVDCTGTVEVPGLGPVAFTLVGSGTIVRSVRHGVDLLVSLAGTTEHSGRATDGTGGAAWTLAGPIVIEESTTVRRAAGAAGAPADVGETDLGPLLDLVKKAAEADPPARKPPAPAPAGKAAPPPHVPTPKVPKAPVAKLPPLPVRGAKGALLKVLPR